MVSNGRRADEAWACGLGLLAGGLGLWPRPWLVAVAMACGRGHGLWPWPWLVAVARACDYGHGYGPWSWLLASAAGFCIGEPLAFLF